MSGKTLGGIRALVRQVLRDEFAIGVTLDWASDELDLRIGQVVEEVSLVRPYEYKDTAHTTTVSSYDIDVSDITDLIDIIKVEYKVDQNPRQFRNCSIFGGTLTIDVDTRPGEALSVYLFCLKIHSLTDSASTLEPFMENVVVKGAAAYAALAKAQEDIDAVHVGGKDVAGKLERWGYNQLALYRDELRKISKPRVHREYPRA